MPKGFKDDGSKRAATMMLVDAALCDLAIAKATLEQALKVLAEPGELKDPATSGWEEASDA